MSDGKPVVRLLRYIRYLHQGEIIAINGQNNDDVNLPGILGLVSTYDGQQVVVLQKVAARPIAVEVRAPTDCVV